MGRPIKTDFCVIGAGAFGVWTALDLARRGHRVLLADAHGPANSRASSGGETRIIRMSYGAPVYYSAMAQRSLAAWKSLFEFVGEPELFQPSGALFTAPAGNPHLEASAKALQTLRIRHSKLSARELRERFPQIRLPKDSNGLYEPDSGVLLARRAVRRVWDHALSLGVEYVHTQIDPNKLDEYVRAQVYIFACGPWLPSLFPKELGGRIFPTRQDVFFFGCQAGDTRFEAPAMPAWVDFHSGVYALPNIEDRGLKIAFDAHGPRFDPESGSRLVSPASLKRMRQEVSAFLPALAEAPVVETRVCQYENTSNGDFLIDWLRPGKVMAVGGGSGHGFKHGPAVGAYAAGLAEGKSGVPAEFSLASKGTRQSRSVY